MTRLRAVLSFALLIAYGCAPTTASKVIQGAVVAANVADVHSTKLGLESRHGREANSLMPDSWLEQGLVKAVWSAGVIWLGTTLEVRGHRTFARVLQASLAAVTAGVAARNYTITR